MSKDSQTPGWWVYVVECESGVWYTGVSNDVEKRFKMHAEGKGAKFFRLHRPLRIAAARACSSKSEALKAEAALKQLEREAKARWITENPYPGKATR